MSLRTTTLAVVLAMAIAPSAMAQQGDHPHDDDRFEQMQEMMEGANRTTDPAERQKMMQEHAKAMGEEMQSMRGLMGHHPEGDMPENLQKTQERMDQMQKMMEQIVTQQQMMMDMPGNRAGKP